MPAQQTLSEKLKTGKTNGIIQTSKRRFQIRHDGQSCFFLGMWNGEKLRWPYHYQMAQIKRQRSGTGSLSIVNYRVGMDRRLQKIHTGFINRIIVELQAFRAKKSAE